MNDPWFPGMDEGYRTIVADPPWNEAGGGGRGAQNHYPLIRDREEILSVMVNSGAWKPSPRQCHLYLWVTNSFLIDGLWLMASLNFRYVTNLAWTKVKGGNVQIGLGQYFRGSHELCLFGVAGDTLLPETAQRSAILAPRERHSAKPEDFYRLVEATSQGPFLEMFCRSPRAGWDAWGNEV